mgnify:CR=1 FL=1
MPEFEKHEREINEGLTKCANHREACVICAENGIHRMTNNIGFDGRFMCPECEKELQLQDELRAEAIARGEDPDNPSDSKSNGFNKCPACNNFSVMPGHVLCNKCEEVERNKESDICPECGETRLKIGETVCSKCRASKLCSVCGVFDAESGETICSKCKAAGITSSEKDKKKESGDDFSEDKKTGEPQGEDEKDRDKKSFEAQSGKSAKKDSRDKKDDKDKKGSAKELYDDIREKGLAGTAKNQARKKIKINFTPGFSFFCFKSCLP